MRDQEFEHWLKERYPNPNNWITFRSETRRIAKYKGNLDELYERDGFALLLKSFQCSQRDGNPPKDNIPHNAKDPYKTARFRRKCLELYSKFYEQYQIEHAGVDDTFDDLPSMDYSLIGSDGGVAKASMRSNINRDPRVRKAVVLRAEGRCERASCGAKRDFSGFLDVHHIFGIEKSDRYWNCVALCPNCHREAHAAPNRDEINAILLEYAMAFKGQPENGQRQDWKEKNPVSLECCLDKL